MSKYVSQIYWRIVWIMFGVDELLLENICKEDRFFFISYKPI